MRYSASLLCSAFALLLLAPTSSSLAQDPPLQGEDYGTQRLPRDVYQRILIPPETVSTPAPVPPPTTRSQAVAPENGDETPGDAPSACGGMGCPPAEITVARQLLEQGPDTTQIYSLFESRAHQFAVVGFVKEGWPLSVEYSAEPGTVTVLRIKLYHHRKILIFPIPFFEVAFQANLDALEARSDPENPWHRTVTIPSVTLSREADAAADNGLHVARYEVRSYRVVNGQVDRRQRAPLNVIGMTVGPNVVGSLTLYADQFGNRWQRIPVTNNPATTLEFKYQTDKNYDLLKERIERYSNRELDYAVARVIGTGHSATRGQSFRATWRVRNNQAPGRYRASILGWWRCQGGVTVVAGVLYCPNDPNWAITSSGDVNLYP